MWVVFGLDCSQHYRRSNDPFRSGTLEAIDPYLKVTLARNRCTGHARVSWQPFGRTVLKHNLVVCRTTYLHPTLWVAL